MITNGLDSSLMGSYLHLGNLRQPFTLENYFFVYRWKVDVIPYVLYTERDLSRIHRLFGHPSIRATYKLFKIANPEDLDNSIKEELEKITEENSVCETNGSKSRPFKFPVGTEEMRFNNRIIVDTMMFLDTKPVIRLVDESTHFAAAFFLRNQSSSEI